MFHEGETAVSAQPTLQLWAANSVSGLKTESPYFFLGVDGEGRGYLALSIAERPPTPEGVRWASLREMGALLDDTGAGIFTTAVALIAWHRFHTHCANCGAGTDVVQGGWVRLCPVCNREHYPRTDPAVIMTVVGADDRVLLGRQAAWPEHRYSTGGLRRAGRVAGGRGAPGSSRRVGCGGGCGAVPGQPALAVPVVADAGLPGRGAVHRDPGGRGGDRRRRWWSREELQADIKAGNLVLPPAVSIARRLIEDWFGGPIPDDPAGW